MVNSFRDNFGENSISSVGKWEGKKIFMFSAIFLFKCLNNVILGTVMA